jgi:hypothetical protein
VEYSDALSRTLTDLEQIAPEQAAELCSGGDPASFRSAVAALRGTVDEVGRTAFVAFLERLSRPNR